MQEKEHILKLLKDTKIALRKKEYIRIKEISNRIVHSSSSEQDPDVIFIAVIIYSLSKLIEREHYQEYSNWNEFYKDYIKAIDELIKSLEKNDLKIFHTKINYINTLIEKLSGQLKIFIADVFRKARINKASKIYEHGISMTKTAKILGISIWELAEYAGQTRISDINLSITMPVKDRIELAEEFFE
jgi:hypothetical protein